MRLKKGFVSFDSFGGRVTSCLAPDRNGHLGDVVLGALDYGTGNHDPHYVGALVGRFAGRIAGARFAIDGVAYQLRANDGPNLLHGGNDGFSQREWRVLDGPKGDASCICFTLVSPDGDQGFPGEIEATATYRWDPSQSLELDIEARSTRATPFNLTQHIYWNLGGPGTVDVREHTLQIQAERFLPIGHDGVRTGELRAVDGTPFDLRSARRLGLCLDSPDPQIAIAQGFDHCWALEGEGFREAAVLSHPPSGRRLTVSTNQAGLQVYSANHFGGGPTGMGGAPYGRHAGIALETQAFPNAPNQPGFPDTILRPGQTYRHRTLFRFD